MFSIDTSKNQFVLWFEFPKEVKFILHDLIFLASTTCFPVDTWFWIHNSPMHLFDYFNWILWFFYRVLCSPSSKNALIHSDKYGYCMGGISWIQHVAGMNFRPRAPPGMSWHSQCVVWHGRGWRLKYGLYLWRFIVSVFHPF